MTKPCHIATAYRARSAAMRRLQRAKDRNDTQGQARAYRKVTEATTRALQAELRANA